MNRRGRTLSSSSSYPSSAASSSSHHGGYIPWNGGAMGIPSQSSFSFSPSEQVSYNDQWERHVDANTGLTYFANSYTGESRWSDDAKWIMMEQSRRAASLNPSGGGGRVGSNAHDSNLNTSMQSQYQHMHPNIHLERQRVSAGDRRNEEWDNHSHLQSQQPLQQPLHQPLHPPWEQDDRGLPSYQRSQRQMNSLPHSTYTSDTYYQHSRREGEVEVEEVEDEKERLDRNTELVIESGRGGGGEGGGEVGHIDATLTSISPPSSLSPSTPVMFTPRGDAAPIISSGDNSINSTSTQQFHYPHHGYHQQHDRVPLSSSSLNSSQPLFFPSSVSHAPFVSRQPPSQYQYHNHNHPGSIDYSSQAVRRRSLSKGVLERNVEVNNTPPWLYQARRMSDGVTRNTELASPDSNSTSDMLVRSPSRGDRSSSRRERRRRAERSILESRRFFAAAFHPNGIDVSEDKTLRKSAKGSSSDASDKSSPQKNRTPRLYDTPPSTDVDAEVEEEYKKSYPHVDNNVNGKDGDDYNDEEGDDDDDDADGTLAEALADGAALVHPNDDIYEKNNNDDDDENEFGNRYLNDDVESGLAMPVANDDLIRPQDDQNNNDNDDDDDDDDERDIRQIVAREQMLDQSIRGKTNRKRRSKSQRARDAASNFVGMTLEQRAAWLRTQLTSVGGGIASDAYAVAALISERSVPWVQGFLGAVVIAAGAVRNTGLAGGSLVGGVSARDYVRTVSAEAALQMSPTGEIPISLRNVHQQVRETNARATAMRQGLNSALDDGTGYATCEDDRGEEGNVQAVPSTSTMTHSSSVSNEVKPVSSSLVPKSKITLTDVLFSAGAVKRLLRPCAEAVTSSTLMAHCPPLEGERYVKHSENASDSGSGSNFEKLEKGREDDADVIDESITTHLNDLAGRDSGLAKEIFAASAPNGMLSPSKLPV